MESVNEVPKRSELWFSAVLRDEYSGRLLDRTAFVICLALASFSFIVFWPIVSQFTFEEVFFTPLAPFLMNAIGYFGIGPNDAIRILFIASFAISTIGIYLLVRELTKRHVTSILAAIIYLMPPVPVFVLSYLRTGLFQHELESARNFFTIVYGDGAHFLGLALIPFAVLFLLRYLKGGRRSAFLSCVLLCALILLSNRSATLSLILILASVATTELFLGLARVKIKRFLIVVFISLGLVSFWYTPTFLIASLLLYKDQLVENIRFFFPLSLIVSLLGMFFSFVFFARHEKRQAIFVFFLLLIVFLVVMYEWISTGHSLVPHPQRLFANLNMFFAIVISLGFSALFDRFDLHDQLNAQRWSAAGKSLAAIIFGFVSFMILSAAAFIFSPFAVFILAGDSGVWSRISAQVFAERQHAMAAGGTNFSLVRLEEGNLYAVIGAVITVVSIVILISFMLRDGDEETE